MNLPLPAGLAEWLQAVPPGSRFFPLSIWWDGERNQKKPMVKSWNDANSDWQQFNWVGATGLGILSGGPGGLYLFDCDDWKEGSEAQEWMAKNGLPVTRTHWTISGGTHFIYRLPPTVTLPSTAGSLAYGLDTRGDGGMIAFGDGYEIIDGREPALLPPSVCAILETHRQARAEEAPDAAFQDAEWTDDFRARFEALKTRSPHFVAALGQDTGDRSKALLTIAHQMVRAGFTTNEFAAVVMDVSRDAGDHVEDQQKPLRLAP